MLIVGEQMKQITPDIEKKNIWLAVPTVSAKIIGTLVKDRYKRKT